MFWKRKINSTSIIASFDHWIFQSYPISVEHLGWYRIVYAFFNLLFLFGFNFSWLSQLPVDFYAPPMGIAELWHGFPNIWVLYFLNTVIVLTNFALLIGYRTFWASVLHSLFLIIAFSLVFSLGNTYHIILWLILPLVMALSNWGAALSWDAVKQPIERKINTWPITMMSLLVGFAFFTSGFAKILGGWLSWDGSAVWQYFINVRHSVGRGGYLPDSLLQIDNLLFWEVLDWAVVFFETGFLLAVFRKAAFRFFCVLGVLFHLGVLLILGISFSIHLVVFLLFIPWKKISVFNGPGFYRMASKIESVFKRRYWHITLFLIMGIYFFAFFYNPFPNKVDGPRLMEWLMFGIAITGIGRYYLK